MSADHWHYASDIHGAAEEHHRHYDLERAIEELRGQVRELRAIMIEFGLELSEAQERIHRLEQQSPGVRQAGLGADPGAAAEPGIGEDQAPAGER